MSSLRKESFSQDFLECGICFSTFTEPKFLPCVHTFCKECLSQYIRSVTSAQNPRFNCPTCRENIDVPDPRAPQNKWADQFKNNFLINNLIGIVESGEEPVSLSSTLQGRTCSRHPSKPLEFFCVDCDAIICGSCAPTLHRACLQVITLDEAAQDKRGALGRFLNVFNAHLTRSETKKAEQEKEIREMHKMYAREKQKIIENAAARIQEIKRDENKCLEQLESTCTKFSGELTTHLEEHRSSTLFLKKLRDAADSMVKTSDSHKVMDQFSNMQQYYDKLSSYKSQTSCEIQMRRIEFVPSMTTATTLGRLSAESSARQIMLLPIDTPPSPRTPGGSPLTPSAPPIQVTLSPRTPTDDSSFQQVLIGNKVLKLERTFSTKIKGDKSQPNPRDAATVVGDILVVTDGDNSCVKSFYMHGTTQMHSKLTLESHPHGVTRFVGNMVAVTVPKVKQIAILSVTPNLILQNILKTGLKYWSITAVSTDAFAVGTCPGTGPVSIHILSMEGQVLKTIHNGDTLFANPLHMLTLSTGNIMVSDCTVSKVCCLRQNGNVLFHCVPASGCSLKKPMGMADDGQGCVLLVDRQPALVLMDYSGHVRYVLQKTEGLKDPKSVAIGQKGTVFVINESGKVGVFKVA